MDQVIATVEPAAEDTTSPLILDVTSLPDTIQALVSHLQPEITTTGEPAAHVNYAALPGDVTANPFGTERPDAGFRPPGST